MMLVDREARYPNLAVKFLILGLVSKHSRHQKRMTAPSGEQFDLLVIGGGITGCGVARDASMRGLRVALFEAEDFASGTSGRSSRLIHGADLLAEAKGGI